MTTAARVLMEEGVVVLPTDTVYGIAAILSSPPAVRRIFEIKRRSLDKPLAVLASSSEDAMALGQFSEEAASAARKGWPGALTVVVPAKRPLPQLGGDGASVGLRVPDHSFALGVLRLCGPLAASSANLSGKPEAETIAELQGMLGDAVDLYVDGGTLASSPSKVVSFLGPVRVLRE